MGLDVSASFFFYQLCSLMTTNPGDAGTAVNMCCTLVMVASMPLVTPLLGSILLGLAFWEIAGAYLE